MLQIFSAICNLWTRVLDSSAEVGERSMFSSSPRECRYSRERAHHHNLGPSQKDIKVAPRSSRLRRCAMLTFIQQPRFSTDVLKPMQMDPLCDFSVQSLSGGIQQVVLREVKWISVRTKPIACNKCWIYWYCSRSTNDTLIFKFRS